MHDNKDTISMLETDPVDVVSRQILDPTSFLTQSGWLRSLQQNEVVDAEGQPIPWLTYAALKFLQSRITKEMSVFEYGSGNSTLWWSSRVAHVVSCEHDKEWFALYKTKVPANVEYLYRRYKQCSDYADEIGKYAQVFDVLVIDGRDRVSCAGNCLPALKGKGVVIWDNSDRPEDQEGYDILMMNGFRRIDFWGMGPLSSRGWCTSVFYRSGNCLGI